MGVAPYGMVFLRKVLQKRRLETKADSTQDMQGKRLDVERDCQLRSMYKLLYEPWHIIGSSAVLLAMVKVTWTTSSGCTRPHDALLPNMSRTARLLEKENL